MSDDTKALVERAREVAGYKYQHHTIHVPVVLEMLADTIERLERDRDALAERCEKLREALNQIAVLAEWQTSGPDTSPRCKSDALSASQATSLRGSISEIARAALAAPKNGPADKEDDA